MYICYSVHKRCDNPSRFDQFELIVTINLNVLDKNCAIFELLQILHGRVDPFMNGKGILYLNGNFIMNIDTSNLNKCLKKHKLFGEYISIVFNSETTLI